MSDNTGQPVMHTLHITTTYADGFEKVWTYDQPGTAADAHDNLARRWREAKAKFTRDRKSLQLTRAYDDPEIGRYVDVVTHVPWGGES